MVRRCFITAGVIVLTLAFTTCAFAQKNILFIFDASGSMKTTMHGKSKLNIAKEVMTDLVGDLPADANVGLEVYGNKEGAECDAIDVMVPVAKLDVAVMKKAIDKMEAKGKTPIAKSLEKGAALLRNMPGEKALILVSDGEETCGGDPVIVAGNIKKEFGIDVVIQAVGFGVDKKTKEQLEAIALAGGGAYYAADSAEELKKSLVKIKEVVAEKKPEPPAEPPKVELPKPEPPKEPQKKEILNEEFDKPQLSAEWAVVNEDADTKMIEKGALTIVASFGDPVKDTAKNIHLYKKDGLPENYDILLKLKTEVYGYWSNYNIWDAQMAGIVLYADKDNLMYLVPKARADYDKKTQVFFIKYSKGEAAPDLNASIACPNIYTYQLKIEKRGHKYTGFVLEETDKGQEWRQIGSYTVLGKTFYPGVIAFRHENAKEVATEFDSFKIVEIK